MRRSIRRAPRAAAVPIMLLTALGSAACGPSAPSTEASPVPPGATASPVPPSTAVLVADGTARDNLPLFAATVESVWASGTSSGRAYVDALSAVGFDRAAMQVTADRTTIGDPAESVQFSVRWRGECLVGQIGPATGGPVTAVMPSLDGDRCLVGETRVIDW